MNKTFEGDGKFNFTFAYNVEETKELRSKLNGNSQVSIEDIRRVALWKLNRVILIPEKVLSKLGNLTSEKNLSIDAPVCREVFESLIQCQGVGAPMASSILKFLRPDVFPIIDVRAYRALYGSKPRKYNFEIYRDYVKRIYEITDRLAIPLFEVDEQLYCWDKETNGKI